MKLSRFSAVVPLLLAGVAFAQCGEPSEIIVTNPGGSGFQFLMNGQVQPKLKLVAGQSYTFILQNASLHPFILTTSTTGGFGSQPLPTSLGVSCECSGCGTCSTTRIIWNVPATLSGTFNYRCSFHAGMGNLIDIISRPVINIQPEPQEVCVGGMIMLDVDASTPDNAALTYQWRRNGVNIPGATDPMIHIMPATMNDAGAYDCVVSNTCVQVTSNAVAVTVRECCRADFNGDRTADFFDYLDFVQEFSMESMMADFNGDMIVDFFDYLDFVEAFDAGCP